MLLLGFKGSKSKKCSLQGHCYSVKEQLHPPNIIFPGSVLRIVLLCNCLYWSTHHLSCAFSFYLVTQHIRRHSLQTTRKFLKATAREKRLKKKPFTSCLQDNEAMWFRPRVVLVSHLLPQSCHWLQVLQCCSQIAPGVHHPGSSPEPSGRLFLLLLLRWAKVRKSHPSAGKPPIKHQKNFTSLGYVNSHKLIKDHKRIPKKNSLRPEQCYCLSHRIITKVFTSCSWVQK